MAKNISFTIKYWKQNGPKDAGHFESREMHNIPDDTSFLEMLDILNEELIEEGKEPFVFDHDCREGICGMCSLYINGTPHGKTETGATTCQLYMRRFNDGDVITVEPWRSAAFPVIKDCMVDRSAFDKIQAAGGYVTVATMRLYATIYPKACHIIHTGFENMLASYARMLQALEQQEDTSPYSAYEEKLLLLAVTYRLCSIFSMSYKVAGKDMARKIEIFESLLKLIEDNYMRERSVAFYADQLCLTPKYLSVMVKSLCGNTVQQLLFKAIIRRSIFLMKNTNMSIQQISYELNFPNASTFGTFFKKHTGLSPKHYRMATE